QREGGRHQGSASGARPGTRALGGADQRMWQEASIHRVRPVRVVVLGGMNMDLIVNVPHLPRPGETVVGDSLLRAPGGKGANQAVAAARLGAQVTMIGRVGHDSFGRDLT